MRLQSASFFELLDLIAKPTAKWAAGSVLALSAAAAWALLEMVAGLSARRLPTTSRDILEEARLARQALTQLAEEDAQAVSAWLSHPGAERANALVSVPLSILRLALRGQSLAEDPTLLAYQPAQLDLSTAKGLFEYVTARSQLLVTSNLPLATPDAQRATLQTLRDLGLETSHTS